MVTTTRSLFETFVDGCTEQLAGYGFERGQGARVFRRFSREQDAFIVELQPSACSTQTEKVFYINVAFVLAPQWESNQRRQGLLVPRLPRSMHGLWQHRIGMPSRSGGDQWRIKDLATLARVSKDVRRCLDDTLPGHLQMLDRDALFVDAAELFGARAERVRAWLLAGNGPSDELERLLSAEGAGTARMIREYAVNSHDPQRSEQVLPESTIEGQVAEQNVVQLLKRVSRCIAYPYDELDTAALSGALDDTNDESAEAPFQYPLMGVPPLMVHLARSPGRTLVNVRVEGAIKQILATRIAALLELL